MKRELWKGQGIVGVIGKRGGGELGHCERKKNCEKEQNRQL